MSTSVLPVLHNSCRWLLSLWNPLALGISLRQPEPVSLWARSYPQGTSGLCSELTSSCTLESKAGLLRLTRAYLFEHLPFPSAWSSGACLAASQSLPRSPSLGCSLPFFVLKSSLGLAPGPLSSWPPVSDCHPGLASSLS